MKVSQLRCAMFAENTPVLLRDAINNFTKGKAAGTAPNNYAAGFVKEQTFVFVHYFVDTAGSGLYTAMIYYTE